MLSTSSKEVRQVMLAPVPCVHLESAARNSMQNVAFGTSRSGFEQQFNSLIPIPVFIYASQPLYTPQAPHPFFRGGTASWEGTVVNIVKANSSGKHANPSIRPPSTLIEDGGDGPFLLFWEVEGLHKLEKPLTLSKFKWKSGGDIPQWPVLAQLNC